MFEHHAKNFEHISRLYDELITVKQELEVTRKALELCVIDNCALCNRVYCHECPIEEKCLESVNYSSDMAYYIVKAQEEMEKK